MMLEPGERTTTIDEQRNRLRSAVASANQTILVADAGDCLVGYIAILGGGYHRNKHSAHIVAGVLQQYAGQGLGTRLFTEGDRWAREVGLHRLELTVMVHNRRAIALYMKMGFRVEGTRRDSLKVDGAYVDEYYMAKLLD